MWDSFSSINFHMRNIFYICYDQKFYNNFNKLYLILFFKKIYCRYFYDFLSISIKYHKSYFVSCIKNFNWNHVSKVVCNCIYSTYCEMNMLYIFGEYIVNVSAFNLGIGRFFFLFFFLCISHFAHQNDPDCGLTFFP